MHPEQKIIAEWASALMDRTGWSLAEMGRRSGVDATTVKRALDPSWKSVSTIKTVDAMAKAAGVSSPLDVMKAGVDAPKYVISAEALEAILGAVLPLVPKGRASERSLRVVAAALAHGLELLGDQSASPPNKGVLDVAARGAIARFRDLTQQ